MNQKLYSIEEASEFSGLGTDTIKKFIGLKAIIPIKNNQKKILINSFGLVRIKKISELIDEGLSMEEILIELD
jgi:hypothetical protein